jgi:primary-amine oxidase
MSARGVCRLATMAAGCALLVAASPARAADAPVDPLSGGEIRQAIKAIEAYSQFPAGAFFPLVTLKEPRKADVLAWSPDRPFAREAFANVYDPVNNKLFEAVVDLKANPARVTSFVRKLNTQPAVYGTEYATADEAVRANKAWQNAMKARGIADPVDDVYLDVWAPGDVELPNVPPNTRLLRALSFYQKDVAWTPSSPTRTTGRSRASRSRSR